MPLRHYDDAAATTATSSPQRLLSSLLTSRAHRHHRRLLLPPVLLIELLYESVACLGQPRSRRPRAVRHYLLSGLFLNDQTAFERMRAVSWVTGDYAALVSAYCSWLRHRPPSLMTSLLRAVGSSGHHEYLPGDDTVRHLCGADNTFSTCGSTGYGRHFLASLCSSGAPPRPVFLCSSDALRHRSTSTSVILWRYMYDQNDTCVSLRWWLSYGRPTGSQSQLGAANIWHFQRHEYAVERSDLTESGSMLLATDLPLYYDRSAYCSASTWPTCSTF